MRRIFKNVKKLTKKMPPKVLSTVTIVAILILFLPPIFKSNAGNLTTMQDRLNRLKVSQTSGITHTIVFTTATNTTGGANSNQVIIAFPDADDGLWCRTAGSLTVTVTGLPDSATALPGTLTATCAQGSGSGSAASNRDRIRIIDVNNLAAGTKYGVILSENTAVLGTPSDTSTQIVSFYTRSDETDSIASPVDSGSIYIDLIAEDQVSVTATVDPSLVFSINTNTVNLGTLTSSSTGTGTTVISTLTTNAASGLVLSYNGATLTSGSNTITAMSSATTSSPGSEQFGINLKDNSSPDVGAEPTCGTGSISIASGYDTANTFKFTPSTTTEIVTATGPVSCSSITISYIANIAPVTEAGSYSTTITFVATGKF